MNDHSLIEDYMPRIKWIASLGALLLLTSGCGKELVGGGQNEGEVRTLVTSEEGNSRSLASEGPHFTYADEGSGGAADAEGTISFDAQVTLIADDGAEVRVTSGTVPGTFRIENADSAEIGRQDVRVKTYARARVEFTRVSANVTGGIVIGGVPLLGEVRVQIGAGERVTVEAPIQLIVRQSGLHELVIDLNAHIWLATANPVTGAISSSTFRSAVEVRAQ